MRTRKKIPKGKREIKIKNKNKKKNEKKEKKVDKKKKKRQTEKPEQRESLQPGGLSAVSTHDMRRASNCYYSNAYPLCHYTNAVCETGFPRDSGVLKPAHRRLYNFPGPDKCYTCIAVIPVSTWSTFAGPRLEFVYVRAAGTRCGRGQMNAETKCSRCT